MIHVSQNQFSVGSTIPHQLVPFAAKGVPHKAKAAVSAYVEGEGWKNGESLVFVGPPSSGKTTALLAVHKMLHDHRGARLTSNFWTERDYLDDMNNLDRLERMTTSLKDDGLWAEYMAWERDFWAFKKSPILFLDNVGHGRTAFQTSEMEYLYRLREELGLATISSIQSIPWANLDESFRAVVSRHALVVLLTEEY